MSTTKAGNFDNNMYKILKENFLRKATLEQRAYIERNTNQQPVPLSVLNKLRSPVYKGGNSTANKIIRSHAQRQADLKAKGKDNLIPLIDKIFFTYIKKEIKRD
jgi:G:T/U-mismatch repair DNA glycosylase